MYSKGTSFTVFETAWGYAGFSASAEGVTGLLLPVARRNTAMARFAGANFDAMLLKDVQQAVRQYFEGEKIDFQSWPQVSSGTMSEFGTAVLRECRKTAYGRTTTYGELACRAGRPGAARAVGTILARNPVPLIIPCHRVLRTDGGLGGFSADGGSQMKRRMLRLESGDQQRIQVE